jgi:hypothetical protein
VELEGLKKGARSPLSHNTWPGASTPGSKKTGSNVGDNSRGSNVRCKEDTLHGSNQWWVPKSRDTGEVTRDIRIGPREGIRGSDSANELAIWRDASPSRYGKVMSRPR